MSYVPENGAGERSCTVVSALARPYSAVEPHPLEMVSPTGISPATWSLGHPRSGESAMGLKVVRASGNAPDQALI